MTNARFSDTRGMTFSLASKPPFYFEGMTTRVFPLRASLYQLQRFVDGFLNVVPKEVGRFRPFVPYVLLMVIDYGKMAAVATNQGWVSQREIMFSVPLQWYKVVGGRWEFHDWAFCTPFIYVDDELSMTLGRTAYGWPKSLAWLAPGLNTWIEDPRAVPRAAAVSTMVFPEVYAGKRQQPRVFLEIHEAPALAPLDFPPDVESVFAPWAALTRAARSSYGLMGDMVQVLEGLGFTRRQDGADPENFLEMGRRAAEMGNLYDPQIAFNTVNLKQFRKSESPAEFCYQALTNAQMRLTSFNRGGLLGDVHILGGDSSGGYAIDLHRWDSLPIIDTLGLEAEDEWQGDGAKVARLRPVFPFWYDVNMDYEVGRTEAWRTVDLDWRDGENRIIQKRRPEDTNEYCTALGAAGQAVAGPFRFPSTTVRVLPLLAQRAKLQSYLDGYLNDPLKDAEVRFTLWGPSEPEEQHAYVYLIAVNYDEMSSATNNIGWWAEREVVACIPVKVEKQREDGTWELQTVGMVPTFSYADSTTAAIARSEVIGLTTTKAGIISPPTMWMADEGPAPERLQTLLSLSSEVLPVVGEGQETRRQVILDIQEGEVIRSPDDHRWRTIGEDWGTLLRDELLRKQRVAHDSPDEYRDAVALALEVMANRAPVSFFTMKQYRDIADPEKACYQSVVQIRRTVQEIYDLREIEGPCHVRIHNFPSQPFVEALGLVTKLTTEESGDVVHCLQPIRPFWMKVSLEEELGQRLWWRAGTETWSGEGIKDPYFGGAPVHEKEGPAWPCIGSEALEEVMNGAPVRLRTKARKWREERALHHQYLVSAQAPDAGAPFSWLMSLDEARRAVEAIDPQMVVETVLSWEWENASREARWAGARAEMTRRLDRLLVGATPHEVWQREIAFFRQKLAEMSRQSPILRTAHEIEESLSVLSALGRGRDALERIFGDLARAQSAEEFVKHTEEFAIQAQAFVVNAPALRGVFWVGIEQVVEELKQASPAVTWERFRSGDDSSQVRDLIQWARQEHDERRAAVIDRLAKAAQKPRFCVPRACVGPEADDVFPHFTGRHRNTFEDTWYVGVYVPPPLSEAQAKAEESGATPARSPTPATPG